MKKRVARVIEFLKCAGGCALFGLGLNLFLIPNGLNAGGLSGIAILIHHIIGIGTVGTISALMNVPLFVIASVKVGKKFFWGSLVGMLLSTLFIDLLVLLPTPEVEPLIGALYGGVICGFGLGFVFSAGVSTGGSDIIVRLLKLRWRNVPIGAINILFDFTVVALSGLVFWNIEVALYSGIAIFVTGQVIDIVVYRFDYSKVALIITKNYEEVAKQIDMKLERGATFLHGAGSYSRKETEVILTAVKKQQVAELKELVVAVDPDAFIIVQEAHQVLGDGFSRYSKDAL